MMTTHIAPAVGRMGRLLIAAVATALALLAVAGPANAEFGFSSFSASLHDPAGNPVTQAGAYADFTTEFTYNTKPGLTGDPIPDGVARDMDIDLPVGLLGNPQSVPQCSIADFTNTSIGCPMASQVGIVDLQLGPDASDPWAFVEFPIYNMRPRVGQTGMLAFRVLVPPLEMDITVRTEGDHGLRAQIRSISQGVPVYGLRTTLWGVPGDPAHDAERYEPNTFTFGHPSPAPLRPFMSAPTECGGELPVTIKMRSWQEPDQWVTGEDALPALTGCEHTRFEPEVAAQPTSRRAGEPSGLDVTVRVPQDESISAPTTPHVRKTVVRLPEGVTLSPASADGLQGCSDAQLGLGSRADTACPGASKLGEVEIDTPLLAKPMRGELVLRSPRPGQLFGLAIVARGPGIVLKLPGVADPDPVTGRLTATFDGTPQLPFDELRLGLKGGPRAPLALPQACGTYETAWEVTSWSGQVVSGSDAMVVDEACGAVGFSPAFSSGSTLATAGAFSPFVMQVGRGDREQELGRIDVDLPDGLLGNLSAVELCAEAQAAAGTCGAASRVGSVNVAAGAGALPFRLGGGVFLTEGYKGAPFGLSIVVPAIAGPFDLGLVVVRARVEVDPATAQLRVQSDPLPRILEGVPLRLRQVRVDIDRDRFMRNPSGCDATEVSGSVVSTAGAAADVASRYQVGDCPSLSYTPRLAMRLVGKRQRREGGHPGLRAVLTQPDGQAANSKVRVALPKSLALDPDNARGLCSYEDGLKGDCSIESKIGVATAYSPLLNRPLKGRVHFVQGVRFDKETGNRIRTLPTLLVKLRGEIDIDLRARSSVSGGKLVTTFPAIPDAPISKFALRLRGGKGGILAATGRPSLCARPQIASVDTDAHNGRQRDFRTSIETPCPKRKKGKRR